MSELTVPAPLWRRLTAATYDVLVLLGLILAGTFTAWAISHLLGAEGALPPSFMRAYLFVITFSFYGWFWTHGGQTLGMRAWRIQLRRVDGGAVNWPSAMIRFVIAAFSWGLAGLGMLWCLIDRRGRSWHDLAAGTEVVSVPKES
jgi:uncharacterized RDD family membrane protein YckC